MTDNLRLLTRYALGPHMFLLDRKGCLRFDKVKATEDFEEKILKLLAEEQ